LQLKQLLLRRFEVVHGELRVGEVCLHVLTLEELGAPKGAEHGDVWAYLPVSAGGISPRLDVAEFAPDFPRFASQLGVFGHVTSSDGYFAVLAVDQHFFADVLVRFEVLAVVAAVAWQARVDAVLAKVNVFVPVSHGVDPWTSLVFTINFASVVRTPHLQLFDHFGAIHVRFENGWIRGVLAQGTLLCLVGRHRVRRELGVFARLLQAVFACCVFDATTRTGPYSRERHGEAEHALDVQCVEYKTAIVGQAGLVKAEIANPWITL
jgi:hypothetical protein